MDIMELESLLQMVNAATSIGDLKPVTEKLTAGGLSGFSFDEGNFEQSKINLSEFINEQIDSFLPTSL